MAAPKKSSTLRVPKMKKRRARRPGIDALHGTRRGANAKAAEDVATKYIQAAKAVKASGRPVRLSIVINPTSSVPDMSIEEFAPAADALDIALSNARKRGAVRVADILSGPEMLSADDVAREIKVSRETVNNKRRRHELLGLEGPKRGVRFPRWQLSERGELLAGLPELFDVIGDHPWAVYRFLLQEHDALDGRTALSAIKAGETDRVADVARSIGEGAFT